MKKQNEIIKNRHDRRKAKKLGNIYRLILINKKTKEIKKIEYCCYEEITLESFLKRITTIDKKPFIKKDYDFKFNLIQKHNV